MKTKLFYLFTVLCITFIGYSCTDDNKNEMPSLAGGWKYESPRIKWEYPQDTIKIEVQEKTIPFAVKEITGMLSGMASKYMALYFTGIDFTSSSDLKIGMLKDGNQEYMGATYKQDSRFLSVQLDTLLLKQMTGVAMPIPPISFTYKIENQVISIYLEKQEIVTILAAMGNMIDGLLISNMPNIPGFSEIPPQARPAVAASLKAQAIKILNMSTVEIGFNLKRGL